MGLNYMVFDNRSIVNGHHPSVGDVVSVRTFAGKGIVAEVAADRNGGYELKYPSPDGLRILRKTVPHWLCFERVEKNLVQLAAGRFQAAGPATEERLAAFKTAWGSEGLCALLAHSNHDSR